MNKSFNWKTYLDLNPDLRINNINNEDEAIKHWSNHGQYENRKYTQQINSNKKSIAIFFSGQIRTNSLSNNKNNNNLILNSINLNLINVKFKNKYNYDIFISTDEIDINKTKNQFNNNLKNIHCIEKNYYLNNPSEII